MKIKVVGIARPEQVSSGKQTSLLNSKKTIQAKLTDGRMQPWIPLNRVESLANGSPTVRKGKKYGMQPSQAKQRRRRRRRVHYGFLYGRTFVKAYPNKCLAANEKFVKGLRAKCVKNDRRCSMDKIRYLEKLENLSVSRYGVLRGLRTEGNVAIEGRKNEILEQMEDKICELQRFLKQKLEKLNRERCSLRVAYQQRYICCKWCVSVNVRD